MEVTAGTPEEGAWEDRALPEEQESGGLQSLGYKSPSVLEARGRRKKTLPNPSLGLIYKVEARTNPSQLWFALSFGLSLSAWPWGTCPASPSVAGVSSGPGLEGASVGSPLHPGWGRPCTHLGNK